MQTWARAAGAVALGPVGDLLRHLGEVRGQVITRFGSYLVPAVGSTLAYLGWVAQWTLYNILKLWLAALRTTATVRHYLRQTLCWHWIQTRRRSPLGNGLQKSQRKQAWFSEPPNKR